MRQPQCNIATRRLNRQDCELARTLFATMAEAFELNYASLGNDYIDRLLAREDFWAIAAFIDECLVGGLTAYTLPMTNSATSELFIYDIAVRQAHRRKGVGRCLVGDLRGRAAACGIHLLFVPADNADAGALDFYRALGGQPTPVTLFTFAP